MQRGILLSWIRVFDHLERTHGRVSVRRGGIREDATDAHRILRERRPASNPRANANPVPAPCPRGRSALTPSPAVDGPSPVHAHPRHLDPEPLPDPVDSGRLLLECEGDVAAQYTETRLPGPPATETRLSMSFKAIAAER